MEIAKGIIETIEAFSELNHEGRELSLVIAGDGPDADLVRKRVIESADHRIKLIGYVRGIEKKRILESSHLMCLPTSYGEGLPNAILEAMAFGIPIITRPVGGIPDYFIEGENGYYVQSRDTKCLLMLLKKVVSDEETLVRIAKNNYNFAKKHFLSSIVAKRLDNIYKTVITQ